VLPFAVPVELHLHASVLVDGDLVAGLAHDDGGLGAFDAGFGRIRRRSELGLAVDQCIARVESVGAPSAPGFEGCSVNVVLRRRD
jgi:hypothetical protein